MKRLIALFSLLMCLTSFGVNITNYPLTNDYSGNELFLLSSIPWKTNFNLPGIYVTKTSDLNSSSNSILFQARTNSGILNVKTSFTTNFVCTTNLQAYCCDGTNQLMTLPNAASIQNVIYRFTSTNGWGSVIITNATGAQSIRDGTSLSYTNIGIGAFDIFSDGACWRLSSRGRVILPSASWSSATTITPAQDTITNIPWTDLEYNNSQGITLRTNATFSRPTQLWITNSGTYMITFSAVLKGSGGGTVMSVWLRENGSDVVRTRTDQGFSGATAQQCMTVNFVVNVGAPTYFELCAASHDASPPTIVGATANPTGYTAPAMPAVIVTINRISDPWP